MQQADIPLLYLCVDSYLCNLLSPQCIAVTVQDDPETLKVFPPDTWTPAVEVSDLCTTP